MCMLLRVLVANSVLVAALGLRVVPPGGLSLLQDTTNEQPPKPVKELDADQKEWVRLTKKLFKSDRMPFVKKSEWNWFSGPTNNPQDNKQRTVSRVMLNRWDEQVGNSGLIAPGSVCAETGDGHFVKTYKNCKKQLSVDFFDERADVRANLDEDPQDAPATVKKAHGTIDVLTSHQVFEHLGHPAIGMANVNRLLKKGGLLVFSTPWVTQDHSSFSEEPNDFFRYTVHNVRRLLECSGFKLKELYGHGNEMTNLAYLAGVGAEHFTGEELDAKCDGLRDPPNEDCKNQYYSMVGAVAHKVDEKTKAEIQECF